MRAMVDPPDHPTIVLDRSERGKLSLTGEQALWFWDQLLSNQLVNLPAGRGAEALLLTPHGRITAALRVLHPDGEVLADLEPPAGRAAELAAFFAGRIFATRVTVRDVSGELGQLTVLGPRAGAIAAATLEVSPSSMPSDDEHATVRAGGAVIARVVRPVPGLDLLLPRAALPGVLGALQAAGAEPADAGAYEELRIQAGLARDRVDYDEGYLPQEAAMERAVHFAKGCYLGQEAVAMTQRGRIKRRLRHLRFAGAARLGRISYQGEIVGTVTSATSAGSTPGFAIATVMTSVPAGAAVTVGEAPAVPATVEELPGTSEGPRLPSARELRESLQR
jgi:folate-binding protein YgfZ